MKLPAGRPGTSASRLRCTECGPTVVHPKQPFALIKTFGTSASLNLFSGLRFSKVMTETHPESTVNSAKKARAVRMRMARYWPSVSKSLSPMTIAPAFTARAVAMTRDPDDDQRRSEKRFLQTGPAQKGPFLSGIILRCQHYRLPRQAPRAGTARSKAAYLPQTDLGDQNTSDAPTARMPSFGLLHPLHMQRLHQPR